MEIPYDPCAPQASRACSVGSTRLQTWTLLALVVASLGLFASTLQNEFLHLDDGMNICHNPNVAGLGPEQIRWMLTDMTYNPRYMPIGWFCYGLERQLFGLNPAIWHAGNVLVHTLNAVLLFFLIKKLLRLHSANSNTESNSAVAVAGMAALVWTVHPLRVEVVSWASGRIYQVAFLFAMLWLLAWLRAQDTTMGMRQRRVFYYASLLAFATSLLTYPLALCAPIVLFGLEVFPLRRIRAPLKGWWKREAVPVWCDKIPFLIVAVVVVAITISARSLTDERFRPVTLTEFGVVPRVMQALYVCAYYVWKPLAPFDLSATYPALHAFKPFAAPFVCSAILVAAAIVAAILLRRRWPAIVVVLGCHVVLLLPVLGLSEYPHSASDRYSYLHGAFWAVVLAFFLHRFWQREPARQIAGWSTALACLCFGLLTWRQSPVWRNTLSVYENIVQRFGDHPSRARFDEVLGVYYLKAGRTNGAIKSLQAAAWFEAHRQDRERYEEHVFPRSNVRLAEIFLAQNNVEKALAHYHAAARAEPNSTVLMKLSKCLTQAGRHAEAIPALSEALRLDPENPSIHHELGLAFRKLGQPAQAERHFTDERRLLAKK